MDGMSGQKFAESLGGIVDPSTPWTYAAGISLPDPEVLIRISEVYGVSIDYLLKGERSPVPRDNEEQEVLRLFRRAKSLNVGKDVLKFLRVLVALEEPVPVAADRGERYETAQVAGQRGPVSTLKGARKRK